MKRVLRENGHGWIRLFPLAALLILLSVGFPSQAGERNAKPKAGMSGPKKDILLSLKIAEARRKDHSRRYFQSLARRMQLKGFSQPARTHGKGTR